MKNTAPFEKACDRSRNSHQASRRQPSRRDGSRMPPRSRPKKGPVNNNKSRPLPAKDKDLKAILVDVENRQKAMKQRQLEFQEAELQISIKLDKLHRDNEILEANYQQSNKARVILLGELEQARDQKSKLADKLSTKQRDLQQFQKLVQQHKALKKHQSELSKVLNQTETRLAYFEANRQSIDKYGQLAAELEDKKKEIKKYISSKVSAEEKAERLSHEVQQLKESKLRSDSQHLKKEIGKLRQDSANKASQLQKQIQAINDLRKQNEELGKKLKSDQYLKTELTHMKDHLNRLQEKNRALNRQNDKLSKLHFTVEKQNTEIRELRESCQQAQMKNKTLQVKLDKQEKIKEMLQLKSSGDKQELQKAQKQVQKMQANLQNQRVEWSSKLKQLQSSQQHHRTTLQTQRADYTHKISQLQQQLSTQKSTRQQNLQQQQSKLIHLQNQNQELLQQLSSNEKEIEIHALNQRLLNLEERRRQEVEKLGTENYAVELELQHSVGKLKLCEEKIQDFKNKNDQLEKEVAKLSRQNASFLQVMRQNLPKIQSELSLNLTSLQSRLSSPLQQLSNKLITLIEKLHQYQAPQPTTQHKLQSILQGIQQNLYSQQEERLQEQLAELGLVGRRVYSVLLKKQEARTVEVGEYKELYSSQTKRMTEIKHEKDIVETQMNNLLKTLEQTKQQNSKIISEKEVRIYMLERQLKQAQEELKLTMRSKQSQQSANKWENSAYFVDLTHRQAIGINEVSGSMLIQGLVIFKEFQQIESIKDVKTIFVCINENYGVIDLIDIREKVILVKSGIGYQPYPMPNNIKEYLEYHLAIKEWILQKQIQPARKAKSEKNKVLGKHLPSSESISDEEEEMNNWDHPIQEIVGEEESPLPRAIIEPDKNQLKELQRENALFLHRSPADQPASSNSQHEQISKQLYPIKKYQQFEEVQLFPIQYNTNQKQQAQQQDDKREPAQTKAFWQGFEEENQKEIGNNKQPQKKTQTEEVFWQGYEDEKKDQEQHQTQTQRQRNKVEAAIQELQKQQPSTTLANKLAKSSQFQDNQFKDPSMLAHQTNSYFGSSAYQNEVFESYCQQGLAKSVEEDDMDFNQIRNQVQGIIHGKSPLQTESILEYSHGRSELLDSINFNFVDKSQLSQLSIHDRTRKKFDQLEEVTEQESQQNSPLKNSQRVIIEEQSQSPPSMTEITNSQAQRQQVQHANQQSKEHRDDQIVQSEVKELKKDELQIGSQEKDGDKLQEKDEFDINLKEVNKPIKQQEKDEFMSIEEKDEPIKLQQQKQLMNLEQKQLTNQKEIDQANIKQQYMQKKQLEEKDKLINLKVDEDQKESYNLQQDNQLIQNNNQQEQQRNSQQDNFKQYRLQQQEEEQNLLQSTKQHQCHKPAQQFRQPQQQPSQQKSSPQQPQLNDRSGSQQQPQEVIELNFQTIHHNDLLYYSIKDQEFTQHLVLVILAHHHQSLQEYLSSSSMKLLQQVSEVRDAAEVVEKNPYLIQEFMQNAWNCHNMSDPQGVQELAKQFFTVFEWLDNGALLDRCIIQSLEQDQCFGIAYLKN